MSLPAGGVLRTRRRAPPPGRGAWGALRRAVASHPNRSYWLGSALYSAFAFACYRVASLLPASHEAVGTSAVLALTHFLSVALLCRLAYALAVRGADWPAGRLARALVTVLAAAAMVVLYCASKLFYNWLAHATGIADPWAPLDYTLADFLRSDGPSGFALVALVLVTAHACAWFVKLREQELARARLRAELADARLGALRSHLQPHFLFNALNSVSALIHVSPAGAERMLEQLQALLRLATRQLVQQLVPLRDELEFVRLYVELEQIRFGPRLRVEWSVDAGVEELPVPPLTFQLLVENAIRHGVSGVRGGGRVEIVVRRTGARLALAVRDSGGGRGGGGAGVGLANTVARLEQLYGSDFSLTRAPLEGGGSEALLMLPV